MDSIRYARRRVFSNQLHKYRIKMIEFSTMKFNNYLLFLHHDVELDYQWHRHPTVVHLTRLTLHHLGIWSLILFNLDGCEKNIEFKIKDLVFRKTYCFCKLRYCITHNINNIKQRYGKCNVYLHWLSLVLLWSGSIYIVQTKCCQ